MDSVKVKHVYEKHLHSSSCQLDRFFVHVVDSVLQWVRFANVLTLKKPIIKCLTSSPSIVLSSTAANATPNTQRNSAILPVIFS